MNVFCYLNSYFIYKNNTPKKLEFQRKPENPFYWDFLKSKIKSKKYVFLLKSQQKCVTYMGAM